MNSSKKLGILLGMMAAVTLGGALITFFVNGNPPKKEDRFTVVTSFYPVYIAAKNIVDGVEDVTLINMTENQGTCLHDYQITTEDMKSLEQADVFLYNGGGMESFLDDVQKIYPKLLMIDTSKGIPLIFAEGNGKNHDNKSSGEASHDHGSENGHIWMDPVRYQRQVENIRQGLAGADKGHSREYAENARIYSEKIEAVRQEWEMLPLTGLENGVVTFHDAFAYLAEMLGITVVHGVDLDADTSLSAGEAARIIEEVRDNGVKYLFTEKQLQDAVVERIAEETGAAVFVLDSLVSGASDKDAYLDGMHANIAAFQNLLAEE